MMYATIIPSSVSVASTLTSYTKPLKLLNSINILRGFCTSLGIMERPIVELPGLGALQGSITEGAFTQKKIYQFLGVKYAEPPSGSRRFKAPVPVEPWDGIKKAEKYGRASPQFRHLCRLDKEDVTEKLEDCLNMCVYSNNLNGKKPVMVYIHGGGFIEGNASQHPPNYLLEKDIVLVVPQYRVGPLGFLSTMSEEIPGNAAILDLILALKWVQKYIGNFGGDASNVTIVGQSAGACLASALTYCPKVSEDLFHKVILQSGSSMASWSWDVNPEKNARDILNRAGFEDSSKMSVDELNKHFMELDVQTLYESFNEHMVTGTINGIHSVGGHRLTIGGPTNLFPTTPYDIRRSLQYRKNLSMLAGVVKNDASFGIATIYDYLKAAIGLKNQNFNSYNLIDFATRIMGCEDVTGGLPGLASSLYFTREQIMKGNFREMANGLFDFTNTTIIKGPILRAAQANAQFNPENTYLYSFDYKGEHTRFAGLMTEASKYPFNAGVSHSDDNLYLYPYPKNAVNLNCDDKKMVKKMIDLWTSFATNGKPSSTEINISWPAFNKVVGPYLHINTECKIGDNFTDEYTVLSREAREPKFRCQYQIINNTEEAQPHVKEEEVKKNTDENTLYGQINKDKIDVTAVLQ